MQIKQLLWTLLALTATWVIFDFVGGRFLSDFIYIGGSGERGGYDAVVRLPEIMFLALFIAWLVTIYRNLSAPQG